VFMRCSPANGPASSRHQWSASAPNLRTSASSTVSLRQHRGRKAAGWGRARGQRQSTPAENVPSLHAYLAVRPSGQAGTRATPEVREPHRGESGHVARRTRAEHRPRRQYERRPVLPRRKLALRLPRHIGRGVMEYDYTRPCINRTGNAIVAGLRPCRLRSLCVPSQLLPCRRGHRSWFLQLDTLVSAWLRARAAVRSPQDARTLMSERQRRARVQQLLCSAQHAPHANEPQAS
jgi:hypothetical protein